MAQLQRPEKVDECTQETTQFETKDVSKTSNKNTNKEDTASFKFNVQAPEFVPRSHTTTTPMSSYFYPYFQYLSGGTATSDWLYVGDQDTISYVPNQSFSAMGQSQKDVLPEEVKNKIIKQVEYQLSDMSLLANENLLKQMNKDPEGFVPISSVSTTKKIKSLITNQQTLAHALLSSTKLIVSNDGKKVKRRTPFNDKDKEDLQLRTVVAENLPDDHSHHNIEKIFKVAGSVKTIRVCHPQDPNSSRARGDIGISNKLHALIEFENPEAAERAVEKLNDERNWRKGLRVRLLLRRSPKSVLKSRKSDFDGCFDDEDSELTEDSDGNNVEESMATNKKAWNKGRGKLRSRTQIYGGRGLLAALPQCNSSPSLSEGPVRQVTKGPRMPDGTRGFTMGRGKPFTSTNVQSTVHVA
ncbi:la-related protein 6C-like [Nicotiana tabacum]|uniref:La-related protein 6C-like n=1 Tax=Nicotiana tabacum TaxID=4097 RepID=A0A1S4D5N7_TOBAC|nr:PREDICTED: la-related protein 6C-like [Nicotiana tabacum]